MPIDPSPYRQNLDRNPANHVPLSPVVFLQWAADVYPDRVAVVHGALRQTWAQTFERARLASPETSVGRLRHRVCVLRRLQHKRVERARLLHGGKMRIG